MRVFTSRSRLCAAALVAWLFAFLALCGQVALAQPGRAIIPQLQQQFGLSEAQVRGALGALLVYVRDRLPGPQFDQLARSIPDADQIMQDVKLRGIVVRPLDRIDDYQQALSSLGIGQSVATQFPSAVVELLRTAGYDQESDMLAQVLK